MSVALLLPSKEINGADVEIQGPGINTRYGQDVRGKGKSWRRKPVNSKTSHLFESIFKTVGCSALLKG